MKKREKRAKAWVIVLLSFLVFPFLARADINLNIIGEQNNEELISNLKRYIPDFSYKFYPRNSEFASRIIKKLKPQRLPLIVYDSQKLTLQEKQDLFKKRILVVRKGYHLFPPQQTHYLTKVKLLNRERIPNQIALFTMSLCPYAKRAEWRIIKFIKEKNLPVDLKIYFIAEEKNGEITSLHGPDEVEEDIHQVLIQRYWPQKLFDYLLLTEKVSHFEALKKIGISYTRIDRLRKEGKKLLAENIKLAHRLGIRSSPTFMWENVYLISGVDNIMEILNDKAKEVYKQTHPRVKYIFVAQNGLENYRSLFDYLRKFFRLVGSFIPYNSPLASRYIKKYGIKTLPYILVKKSSIPEVNSVFKDKLKWQQTPYGFVLPREEVIKYAPVYYISREKIPDRLDILGKRKDIKAFKNSSFIKTLQGGGLNVYFYTVGLFSRPRLFNQLKVKKLPLILWENQYLIGDLHQILSVKSFREKITGLKTNRKIYIDFFHSPSCHFCRQVEEKVLPRIKEKYGGIVDIVYFNTLDENNHKFLMEMEAFREVERRGIPKIFVGKKVLIGRKEIGENLEQEILNTIISGEKIFKIRKPLTIYYFYNSTRTKEIEDRISLIENRYSGEIIVKKYDTAIKKNMEFLWSLTPQISNSYNYTFPLLVINNKIYPGDEIDNLDRIIQENLIVAVRGEKNVVADKLRRYSLPAILTAGLLDGINPCAFTVMVFFISFLTFAGYRKKEMVYVGFSFILAVFIAYFLIGLGIFATFYKLKFYTSLAKILKYVITGIVFILAGFNIYDYIIYKIKNKPQSTVLKLPQKVKFWIQKAITSSYRKEGEGKAPFILLGIAFSTGFFVSILESVCTGQVYFPTIGLLTQLPPELRFKSLVYLFLYNMMFVIPLIMVFILGLWGVTSQQFGEFMKKHLGKIKLATAFLFLFLGYILLIL